MVELLKNAFAKIFNTKPIKEDQYPVLKTRTQLIEEGRGAYVPKRHRHDTPHLVRER